MMPAGATELEMPSDRPAFHSWPYFDGPPAATAVFLPRERRTSRSESAKVYLNLTRNPEMDYFARRHLPTELPVPRRPGNLRPPRLPDPSTRPVADLRTPEDREAAMRRQPFELDGATVLLVREGETPNVRRVGLPRARRPAPLPVELRTAKIVERNCSGFGFLRKVDPACFAAPDLATVCVILQLEHPSEIPRELQIEYIDGSTSVVPVEIVRVWDRSHSWDGNGQYVRLFQLQAPAAAA